MSLAEGVVNGIAQLMGRAPEVTEKTTVTLEDVSVKGWWKNKKGDKIHINPDTMVMIQDGKDLTILDLETPRRILEEGGYTLTSLPPEERVAPVASETQDVAPSAQVVDLAAVRVATGGEPVSLEQEHKNALVLESEAISAEIEVRKASIFKKFTELAGALGKKKKNAARATASRLLEEATTVYQQSLDMKKEVNGKELTSEYMTGYRTCLESLRDIEAQVDTIVLDVQKPKQPGAPDPIETGNAAGAHNNLNELLRARENAPIAPEGVTSPVEDTAVPPVVDAAKDTGAGTKARMTAKLLTKTESGAGDAGGADGGGEGPKEGLEALLKTRQEKVSAIIDVITTPQGFAEFRRTLRKVEVKDSQEVGVVRWYFIDQDTLAKELSEKEKLSEIRRLGDDEKKQVYVIEDFLRDKLRRKFFELKDADVDNFYNQEQAKVIAAQSEADFDAVVASWPKHFEEITTWKGLLDTLTEVEKNKIDDGYRQAVGGLRQNIEIRKNELRLVSDYQALDTFVTGRLKGKETILLLQDIILEAYRVFREKVVKQSEGKISDKECEELWREKNGEQRLQRFVVNHLQVIEGVEPGEGEKIFRASIAKLQEGR